MEQRLSRDQEKILLSWLNLPFQSRLKLLYKATRDSCDGAVFHANCENQGPLLVIAYNTNNFVYGGYTSLTRHRANEFRHDCSAFLFRLEKAGNLNPIKYDGICEAVGIRDYGTYGPWFVNSSGKNDMLFFQATSPQQDGVFKINGSSSTFGNANEAQGFQTNGHTLADLCGSNTTEIIEIEVFTISKSILHTPLFSETSPWRKTPLKWDDETRGRLKVELEDFCPMPETKVDQFRALMLGQVGAGKSSFYNTINSIYRGFVIGQAITGNAAHSLTTKYRVYQIRTGKKYDQSLKVVLCDTMGLEADKGLDVTDICSIIDGNIQDRFQFSSEHRITPESPGYMRNPQLSDRVHCAIYVIDASTLSVMPAKIMETLSTVRLHLNQRSIPLLVILTKIDKVCPFVAEDITNVYRSAAIEEKVSAISEKIGLPRSQVLVVKNYESETELDTDVDILALAALRQICRYAESYLYEQMDKGKLAHVD